jgi:hypothetical protein
LSGDTKVVTNRGHIEISKLVGTNGYVKTINGKWTKYHDCRKTRKNADVVKIYFSGGRSVTCTKDHKFMLLNKKWVNAIDLYDESCHNRVIINNPRRLNLWKSMLSVALPKNLMVRTTGYVDNISSGKENDYIGQFGNIIMGKYQMGMLSIITTITEVITKSETYLLKLIRGTLLSMQKFQIIQNGLNLCIEGLPYGMEVQRVKNGTNYNTNKTAKGTLIEKLVKYVDIVETNIKGKCFQNIAQENVNKEVGKGFVIPVKIEPAGKTDVYCLDVEDTSHAFAVCGGILVHNCYDEACHIMMQRPVRAEKVVNAVSRPPSGASDVAKLEREKIWADVLESEMMENEANVW